MKFAQALAVDIVCILIFAIVGRRTHGEANDLIGVFGTAWPFIVGCLVGALAARAWRRPAHAGTGAIIWLCTVVIGLILRVLAGATAQPAFIVVATITLGLLLIGWRLISQAVHRARARHGATAG